MYYYTILGFKGYTFETLSEARYFIRRRVYQAPWCGGIDDLSASVLRGIPIRFHFIIRHSTYTGKETYFPWCL